MSAQDLLNLRGRRYLITGAASGIGRAASKLLSGLGADLLLGDKDMTGLEATACQCSGKTCLLEMDLTDFSLLKEKVEEKVAVLGKLNGFAHVAGRSYIAPLKSVSEKACMELYKLNTYAALELSKLFTGRKIYAGDFGSVVFISSVYGLVGSAANVGYAMTKSALVGMAKALAMEFAPRGIRFNCVAPGFIRTPMMEANVGSFDEGYVKRLESLHPLGLGEASDIANAIAYLFSDMSRWVTGTVLNVDGGFTAQ